MNIKNGEFKSKDLMERIQLFNSNIKAETSFQADSENPKMLRKLRNLIK